MQRYALRDDQWTRIKDFLPGREGHVGGTAADNRLFVAVPSARRSAPSRRSARSVVKRRGVGAPIGIASR